MALKIKGYNEKLTDVIWDNKKRCFKLSNGIIEKEIEYILKPDKGDYPPEDYKLYLFQNNSILEKHIFQVSEINTGSETIGYIFPIQALISDEHDYKDNRFFLKYSFKAFYKLLRQDDNIPFIIPDKENLTLTDFYPEDTVILILWKPNIEKIQNFDIKKYFPFLYKYGYYYIDSEEKLAENSNESITKRQIEKINQAKQNRLNELEKRIVLKPISNYITDTEYIIQLFTNLLPYQAHPLVVFHLLYQIVELLISKLVESELQRFINELKKESKTYKNLSEFKDKLEKLENIRKESNNIKNLFKNSYNNFKNICNEFLKNQELPLIENTGESLYKVRNLIVHNYRELSSKNETVITDLNITFEEVIINLLIDYTEM